MKSGVRVQSLLLGSCCKYCDVLPGNASVISGFWILYLDLLDIHQAEFTTNYYSLNLCTTVSIQPCNHT
jgi:hypothetical protein